MQGGTYPMAMEAALLCGHGVFFGSLSAKCQVIYFQRQLGLSFFSAFLGKE